MPNRMTALFRIGFWGAVIAAFVLAILPRPPEIVDSLDDKAQHLIAFCALGSLAALAHPRAALALLLFGLALFGAAIELVQALPAVGRNPDLLDWMVDLAGATTGLLAVGLIRRFVIHETR